MIIEKSIVSDGGYRNELSLNDYVAEGELTVTITLAEYRELIAKAVELKQKKEHESWMEQYSRANKAEEKVKKLEAENKELYVQIAKLTKAEGGDDDGKDS